jgi:hypothetical protein
MINESDPYDEIKTPADEDRPMGTSAQPLLTPVQARVLGALMEKQRATPDQYPLTLNALVTACNQKTARTPIMKLDPGEVGHVVAELRDRGLIHVDPGGRAERYDHKLAGHFMLDRHAEAVLCALLLRGPQTPGELRTNTARLTRFESLSAVQTTLDELARHSPPLVRELSRRPGLRERRYAHLLCGEPTAADAASMPAATGPADPGTADDHEARIERLEAEIAALRREVEALKAGSD